MTMLKGAVGFLLLLALAACFSWRSRSTIEIRGKAVWKRYTGSEEVKAEPQGATPHQVNEKDRALSHLERVIDRIINKARGVLPFNSILLAMLALMARDNSGGSPGLAARQFGDKLGFLNSVTSVYELFHLTIASLLLSSAVLLSLFVVRWGKDADFEAEFMGAVKIIRWRGFVLELAVFLSIAGLAGTMILSAVLFS